MNSFFDITFADTMRKYLNKAINDAIEEYREQGYSDFTRNRKLDMNTMIRFMLTMNGGSLNKELYEAGIDASPSAFVQQRKNWKYPYFRAFWNIITSYAMMKRGLKDTECLLWTARPSILHMMKRRTLI